MLILCANLNTCQTPAAPLFEPKKNHKKIHEQKNKQKRRKWSKSTAKNHKQNKPTHQTGGDRFFLCPCSLDKSLLAFRPCSHWIFCHFIWDFMPASNTPSPHLWGTNGKPVATGTFYMLYYINLHHLKIYNRINSLRLCASKWKPTTRKRVHFTSSTFLSTPPIPLLPMLSALFNIYIGLTPQFCAQPNKMPFAHSDHSSPIRHPTLRSRTEPVHTMPFHNHFHSHFVWLVILLCASTVHC